MFDIFFTILAFKSNADLADGLFFGLKMGTWLLYTLIFLGLTSIAFVWTWWKDLLLKRKDGMKTKQPWE